MIVLKTRGIPVNISREILAIVQHIESRDSIIALCPTDGTTITITTNGSDENTIPMVASIRSLSHLNTGDIIYISTNGTINTLFRSNSPHNALFITDRCNSNCLMCSQPPRNVDDLDHFFKLNSALIPHIPKDTIELGITGGEPTLLGSRFITLLRQLTNQLPDTDIHILTNGRSFAWKHIPQALGQIGNPRIVYGIPLFSDYYQIHDYIVQARDAFNQTVLGFHNMARNSLRLELRIVLHKQSYKRLPQLAKFIYKNLPFVEHIAFMGLEYTGYTIKNSEVLWIEPQEYESELEEAVLLLDSVGMNPSIYNLPLCLVKPSLWRYSRKSISDWKQQFLKECQGCLLLEQCGGLFETSKRHSNRIRPIKELTY